MPPNLEWSIDVLLVWRGGYDHSGVYKVWLTLKPAGDERHGMRLEADERGLCF